MNHAPDLGSRLARQAPRLRLLVAHLAGPAVRAEVEIDDLVQECFVRAVQSVEGLPPAEEAPADATPEPRLYAVLAEIARHVVVDVARRIHAAKRGAGHGAASLQTSASLGLRASGIALDATGPFTAAARAESERDLLRAFDRLEPDHRLVLGLRQFEGLPAAECARRMGRSEAAVHSLYRRALEAWAGAIGAGGSP